MGRAILGMGSRAMASGIALAMCSCVASEDAFVGARLERLCTQSIPICDVFASCVLDPKSFVEKRFPGGLRLIVRSDTEASTLTLRLNLLTQEDPGSELVVEAWRADCNDAEVVRVDGDNLFDLAGQDRTFSWDIDLIGRGDHLVEVRSDMTVDYLVTVDVRVQ